MDEQIFNHRPKVKLNVLPSHHEKPNPLKVVQSGRFPSWLHRNLPEGGNLWTTHAVLSEHNLPTVCEEAKCPNRFECWTKKTATFLTMGKECTRSCGFCSISYNRNPKPVEENEPERIALSVKNLGLKHVVLTQVARDDLDDGGASHLHKIMQKIREATEATIEILTSDFNGNQEAWHTILRAKPEIFNYNIETVKSLSPRVRHTATYERTLDFLSFMDKHRYSQNMFIKSGLMVGLGESREEVFETITDLKKAGCDIITIGQYLQPDSKKLLVKSFIHPDEFKLYEEYGYSIGMRYMYAGPFVRSSYNADMVINKIKSL